MPNPSIRTAGSLPAYFHATLGKVLCEQSLDAPDQTRWYLANLLSRFAYSDQFYQYSHDNGWELRPLALIYADAVHARSERERRLNFQRMGDVALFVSALFDGILRRRAVRRDYFVAMGCGAYAYLADNPAHGNDQSIFQDLSERFVVFVDVLSQVGANGRRFDQQDVLRLVRLWRETGSRAAKRQLDALGVGVDGNAAISKTRH